MITFLQAAYKFVELPEHSCYDIGKDYIVPTLTIIFSIGGAIWAVNRQHRLEREKTEKLEKQQKIMEFDMLKLNIEKMISNMARAEKTINENIQNMSLENYDDVFVIKFTSVFHQATISIEFQNIFEFVSQKSESEKELFAEFWLATSSTIGYYHDIYDYLIYVNNEYNKLNKSLNDIDHTLSLAITKNIHNVFKPYTDYELTQEQIDTDPKIRLAVLSKKIVDKFKNENDGKRFIIKIKDFLSDIKALSKDPVACQVPADEFFQDTEKAFSYLFSMESLLKSANITIVSYRDKIKKNRETIEKFNAILPKKVF